MHCYCAQSRRVARLLTRVYQQALAEVGINPAQFELITLLSSQQERSQSELAALLATDQTTTSRNLKLLIQQKLVRAGKSKEDARRATYLLTSKGRRTFESSKPIWQKTHQQVERTLGPRVTVTRKVLDDLASIAEHSLI